MKKHEIMGDFVILFPLDSLAKDVYETFSAIQDIIKIALEKDHIEVKKITVRIIKESGK